MKKIQIFNIIKLLLVYVLLEFVKSTSYSNQTLKSSFSISPGMGYSSDMDSIVNSVCYSPSNVRKGGQQAKLVLSTSFDVEQLKKELGISANVKVGYSIFKAQDTFEYLSSFEEDYVSISASYYFKVTSQVNMDYTYAPQKILNENGSLIYDDGKNQMFRLFCGDTLIDSYDEGAFVIASLKIIFDNHIQKEDFQNKFGFKFGAFANLGIDIKSKMQQIQKQGSIYISAFQKGGDPSQLGALLSSQAANCRIDNVDACQNTIGQIINYINSNFPSQFQKQGDIWVSPLVQTGAFSKGYQVDEIGLILSKSYVTAEVEAARNSLIKQQQINNYYLPRLSSVINNYLPNCLDYGFKNQLQNIYNVAANNIQILDSDSGAIKCWRFPTKCIEYASNILNTLNNISSNDVDNLMMRIQIHGLDQFNGYFWPRGNSANSYGSLDNWCLQKTPCGDPCCYIYSIDSFYISEQIVRFHGTHMCSRGEGYLERFDNSRRIDTNTYQGLEKICYSTGGCREWDRASFGIYRNPFYFQGYKEQIISNMNENLIIQN